MFISIEKREEKRRPPKINWIYKNPVLKDYDEDDPDPWKYELIGEPVPRGPKWKLIVKLRHTYREAGKVKGKSSKIVTISFWNFIESWLEYKIQDYDSYNIYVSEEKVYTAFDILVGATGAKGNTESLLKELRDKLRPWQEKALEEYKQCEEFKHAQDHIDAWKNLLRLRMEAHLKDWEARERKRKSEEKFYREQARYHNERLSQGSGSLKFSNDGKQIFKQVWKIGYRNLSIQLHPDKGGDPEQMKTLNGIKDKLSSLVK